MSNENLKTLFLNLSLDDFAGSKIGGDRHRQEIEGDVVHVKVLGTFQNQGILNAKNSVESPYFSKADFNFAYALA